jgi:imidazolonepropionase-like amidohydrolase
MHSIRSLRKDLPPSNFSPKLVGIKTDLLIPGRGQPFKNGAIILHADKIDWVGTQSSIPAKYKSLSYTHVPVLMPGLWDAHVHYFGAGPSNDAVGALGPQAAAGARISRDLHKTLLAGFTSVRELGGYGGEIAPVVNDGTIPGPHIYSSIGLLSMTAGHGDLHDLPLSTVRDACSHGAPLAICDGVPECIRTVRLMIRRGAKVIKVCATGGVGSILDDPEDAQFSPEELGAIVAEAARAKRAVAAHCHGKEGIMNALRAGVRTIEHGSYFDEESLALMKEKGAIFVPTRTIVEGGLNEEDNWPPVSYAKLVSVALAGRKAYALAVKSGVKIALGTDQSLSTEGSSNSHGRNGKELYWAVKAGMSELQAIEACTAMGPETLALGPETVGMHMSPKSGILREGFAADLIALDKNPLEDIEVLGNPDNVRWVWKGGKVFKSP